MKTAWLKIVLCAIVPFALYLFVAERASWRPRVLPHDSPVYAVAFSADGRHITTAQENGTVLDWDVQSKQVIRTLRLPGYRKSTEYWPVFSPDNRVLAVCTDDCSVRLWEVRTGKFLRTFVQSRTEKYVPFVAFSPDSKMLATLSWRTPVKLWDVATGRQRTNFAHSNVRASRGVFSPDGRVLVSTRSDKTVKLWSLATGKLLRVLTAKRAVCDVAFSPDGSVLAAGSESDGGAKPGEVMLWDAKTWQFKRILGGHSDSGPMIGLTFSADSTILASDATGSSRASMKLWDVSTGHLVRELATRDFPLKFSPDGALLATGNGREQSVKLWRMK